MRFAAPAKLRAGVIGWVPTLAMPPIIDAPLSCRISQSNNQTIKHSPWTTKHNNKRSVLECLRVAVAIFPHWEWLFSSDGGRDTFKFKSQAFLIWGMHTVYRQHMHLTVKATILRLQDCLCFIAGTYQMKYDRIAMESTFWYVTILVSWIVFETTMLVRRKSAPF